MIHQERLQEEMIFETVTVWEEFGVGKGQNLTIQLEKMHKLKFKLKINIE